jgi:hypothetical protein
MRPDQLLALKHLTPLPTGSQRYVFRHPLDPELIVKIPRESGGADARRAGGAWYKLPTRYRQFRSFMREMREQIAVRAAAPELPRHMQIIVGFAETDLGFGLVSRAVTGRDGELAPNLRDLLLQDRFTDEVRADLDAFFAWMLASPVVLGDVHIGNLVYGYEPAVGNYFVIVDGIGDKNVIPLNSLSPLLNRMSKRRRIRRIEAKIARLRERVAAASSLPDLAN